MRSPAPSATTPGPWIWTDDEGNVPTEGRNAVFGPRNLLGAGFAGVLGCDHRTPTLADARLIAACPSLLAYAECEAAWNDEDGAHDALPTFKRHGFSGVLSRSAAAAFLATLRRSALAAAKGGPTR